MEIKMIKPTDADYPLAMNLVPFAEKYKLIQIGDLVVVPLFQVIDAISEVKVDIVVHNGVECCPTCMKPIKGTFTKADLVNMLEEIKTGINYEFHDDGGYYADKDEVDAYIQQKINSLKEE